MKDEMSGRITLFRGQLDDVHLDVLVYVSEDSLVVDACKLGKPILEQYGDSDIEYWSVVGPKHKDEVLLKLIRDKFGSRETAKEDFESWCVENGIPYKSECYI